jgi:hypothetical protein
MTIIIITDTLLLTILMNLHNLLNSTTEFEHIKAKYFTVFGLHLHFLGINLRYIDSLLKDV